VGYISQATIQSRITIQEKLSVLRKTIKWNKFNVVNGRNQKFHWTGSRLKNKCSSYVVV